MKLYRVSIDIAAPKLATVIACLSGEGQNLSVVEVEAPHNRRRADSTTRNSAPTRTPGGAASETRTGKIYLEYLNARGPSKIGMIGLALEAQGFNKKSASPLTSRLIAEGKIVRRASDGLISLAAGAT